MANGGGDQLRAKSWFSRWTQHPLISALLAAGIVAAATLAYRQLTAPSATEVASKRISGLAVGESDARFRKALGPPDVNRKLAPHSPWTERLWVKPLYAVQTVSDRDGTAALYSLTNRDASWTPNVFRFTLRSTRMMRDYGMGLDSDVRVSSWRGPGAEYWYSEAHALGGAGDDKTVILTASAGGFDQAGPAEAPFPDLFPCKSVGPLCRVPRQTEGQVARLRRHLAVSTLTVLDEDKLKLDALPSDFRFGPTWDLVSAVR